MKKIQTVVAAFILLALSSFAFMPVPNVGATALDEVCEQNSDSAVCENKDASSDDFVKTLINTLLYIIGALSVLMIIIGGLLYVTSQGDASNITKAKNTLLYAIIGLVVAALAYAIVNWVNDQF